MSGPKYGTAHVDVRRLQELMSEVNSMLLEDKIKKILNDISNVKAATDKTVADFKELGFEELIDKHKSEKNENQNTKKLDDIIYQMNGFIDDEFSLDGGLTDLFVSLLNYEEKLQIIRNYIALAVNTASQIKHEFLLPANTDNIEASVYQFPEISQSSPRVIEYYNNTLNSSADKMFYPILCEKFHNVLKTSHLDDFQKISKMKMHYESLLGTEKINDTEYLALKSDYESLAAYLGEEIECPDNYLLLKDQLMSLREKCEKKTAEKYIADSLNKVMNEMGYDIESTEITSLKSGDTQKNYYDLSDNSVLNISVSDNGAVMFEVMGKGEIITEEKKYLVKNDMDKFCPDYFAIKQKLEAYGIQLNNERLFDADVKYVRGIDFSSLNKLNKKEKINSIESTILKNNKME